MFFIQVVCGRPGGRLQFSPSSSVMFYNRALTIVLGARFTKYVMIYHNIIAGWTYDSDLRRAMIRLRKFAS